MIGYGSEEKRLTNKIIINLVVYFFLLFVISSYPTSAVFTFKCYGFELFSFLDSPIIPFTAVFTIKNMAVKLRAVFYRYFLFYVFHDILLAITDITSHSSGRAKRRWPWRFLKD